MKRFVRLGGLVGLLLVLSACGEAGSGGTPGGGNTGGGTTTASYTDFVKAQNLPTWSQYEADAGLVKNPPDADVFVKAIGGLDEGGQYYCTGQERSLSKTPDKMVLFDPVSASMWVGGLLQGRGYAGGAGSLQELAIRKRAPYAIWIDHLGGEVREMVTSPDGGTVQNAVGKLVQRAITNNVNFGAGKVMYSSATTYDVKQALMSLGISGRYGNFSAAASLSTKKTATDRSITISFTQQLYTINMVRPQSANGFFEGLTSADLNEQALAGNIGKDNLPVYIKSVSYGRILLVSMHSSLSTEQMNIAANAIYRGVDSKVKVEFSAQEKALLEQVKIDIAVIGGSDEGVEGLIRTGDLNEYFTVKASPDTYRPISFNVHDIASDQLVKMTEVHSYKAQECAPEGGTQLLEVKGVSTRFACRAGGALTGRASDGNMVRATFAAGEVIGVRAVAHLPFYKGAYIYFTKDNVNWPDNGFGVLVQTWEFECNGVGRPPMIDAKFKVLESKGSAVKFQCRNGGLLSGHTGAVSQPPTGHAFGPEDTISVREYEWRPAQGGTYMTFNRNGELWPPNFLINSASWKVECS
ncbi:thiol-activated cytolysin family protein [Deinococcus yunweiensis]|uniref:thiol-activated cytolysin family protein n=1 Tax=Deinococcus yunweiensis TaxID=367282 RepID=UPI00398F6C40